MLGHFREHILTKVMNFEKHKLTHFYSDDEHKYKNAKREQLSLNVALLNQ